MNELPHLTNEAREEVFLPDAERIIRIRTERYIHYALAEMALARMNELLEYPQRDRMPCLLLYGATGMGKTKILRKFLRDHPATFDKRVGITTARVVSMQMPPDPDEKGFYEGLLSTLQAPSRYITNTAHLRRVSLDLLRFVGARMLIIDEVHALLAGSYRQQRVLLNVLHFWPRTCASLWSAPVLQMLSVLSPPTNSSLIASKRSSYHVGVTTRRFGAC